MIIASPGSSLILNITLQVPRPIVVKIGGGAGVDLAACSASIADAARSGQPLVVVHGVSAALDRLCAERGVPARTITSPSGHISRYTDAATRDLYVEAAQSVSGTLEALLRAAGLNAETTGPVVAATRKDAVRAVVDGRVRLIRDDYTGAISGVNVDRLTSANGEVLVVPPLATSIDGLLNIDGDRAAAAVAAAVGAETLVILSNVRGLYRQVGDPHSLVGQVRAADLDRALEWAEGRMKRKVIGAREALAGGVARVIIADGRRPGALARALAGEGTVFTP